MARSTLRTHRKFRRATAMLGIPEAHVMGHLELMWGVAYESGDPYLGDATDVELAAGWTGQPGALADALLRCGGEGRAGFIETAGAEVYQVHDLLDHAPDYVKKRRLREEERRQKARADRTTADNGGQRRTTADTDRVSDENGCTPAPAPTPAPTPIPSSSGSEEPGPVAPSPPPAAAAEEDEPSAIGEYTRAIEVDFVTLRGKGTLLAPRDWQLIQAWFREGRPLEVVLPAMARVFQRRAERGERDPVQSLKYCAAEVDRAWAEYQAVMAPGVQEAGSPTIDVVARLTTLAAVIPADLGEDLPTEILALPTLLDGDTEAIEARLRDLDALMLVRVGGRLPDDEASEISAIATATLKGLHDRLDAATAREQHERLVRRIIRERKRLPLLSVFSPDAMTGADRRPEGNA